MCARLLLIMGSSSSRVKTKTKVGIRCFSAKHVALRSKSKDWLAWNQNNVSEWSDIVYLRTVVSVSLHYKIQPIKLLV